MSQVILVTRDGKLTELLGRSGLSVKVVAPADFGKLAQQAEGPSVLVVDLRGSGQLPAELVEFRRRHADVGVAIIVSTLEPQLVLEAMRAGCNDVLTEPLSAWALDEAVRKLLTKAAPEVHNHVLAFVGVKGGVGATTLAVNAAVAVQRAKIGTVLLVDAHVGSGEAALFLGAEPRFSVLDALENVHRVDESFFGSLVEKTKSGVHLLGSSTQALHDQVDSRRVRALFEAAGRTHKVTVLDVPRGNSAMLDSLDSATAVLVVTGQEIASLRNAAQMMETLRGRYGKAKVKVIVNRFTSDAVIALEDIERTIGCQVAYVIPSDYAVAVEALNTGHPIVLGQSRLAEAIRKMARDLAGVLSEAPSSPASVFSRLAWRRV